ncbi:MAG: hypothetical protein ACT4PV_01445 [Planctomycetaceae bacterium]
MNRMIQAVALTAVALGLASCNAGGGPGLPPLRVVAFNFAPGFGGVHLNAPLVLTFTAPVARESVTADSIRIVTTTTTTAEPDPGAPAVGVYVVSGNIVIFLPRIPRNANLSDAGLRIGFTYTIEVPPAPTVIEPVRTIEGDPNVVRYAEFFSTLNHTILPAPADITAEPNLNSLKNFFLDELIQNGVDPCDRTLLDPRWKESPQVIRTVPAEGEDGFGTISGIEPGLGTAFVRMDAIRVEFSEPMATWRIRLQNISIRNVNLGGEEFNLFFFFDQDRSLSVLLLTVFDADSAFDQASVPQGRYILSFTEFSDLAGNPLVNSSSCVGDGTFDLSFSTASSPALPTDIVYTFQDSDQEGHVDVGGLATATNNANRFPSHMAPFVGGIAIDHVAVPSMSRVSTSANPGDTAFWTGRELRYDNGFRTSDPLFQLPSSVRLRGGSSTAATAIIAPLVGNGVLPGGASSDGSVPAPGGKTDFSLIGPGTIRLNTGSLATGPIIYHYRRFELRETAAGRPVLTYVDGSVFPLIILVEENAIIAGDVVLDGGAGEIGFNGDNAGTTLSRPPGGLGGLPGPGGGAGGNGGANAAGAAVNLHGQTGNVPANVLGPITSLSQAVAGLSFMATGGGGFSGLSQPAASNVAYQGGGGAGAGSGGLPGGDISVAFPNESDQGVGGKRIGNTTFTSVELAHGGAGGGGGGADDDGPGTETGDMTTDSRDDGGGGGGGGAGFFGLGARGNIDLGFDDMGTVYGGTIRAVGGRGGSTYQFTTGDPPVGAASAGGAASVTGPQGQGEPGGGGAGGGICCICSGTMTFRRGILLVFGRRGGDAPSIEAGGRAGVDEAGAGGGGAMYFADGDGIDLSGEILTSGTVVLVPGAGDPQSPTYSGTSSITVGVYGDETREPLLGTSRIVSEFFDTLSVRVSYDSMKILSNANLFAPGTISVFLDSTVGASGFPVLTDEAADGTLGLGASPGASIAIPLTFNAAGTMDLMTPQSETRFVIPAGGATSMKRYARVRIVFDVSGIPPATLLTTFAPPGGPPVQIAPGNTVGNFDLAPGGVPAVADLRVRFVP